MSSTTSARETIAAIATATSSDAGVGIIRLSGINAINAAQRFVVGLRVDRPRQLNRIIVYDDSQHSTVLDDGLGVIFPQGESFTGELVVELQLHGGRFLLQYILRLLIGSGLCRLAQAGEFSLRALQNNKLNLRQVSALGQLIHARSMAEVGLIRKNLSAARISLFDGWAEKLRKLLAQIELSIDFIEEDLEIISAAEVRSILEAVFQDMSSTLRSLNAAFKLTRGLQVTLAGPPNAGKSSLFNAILGCDRAIVSAEAGTTRDIITEDITLGRYPIRLADTAGIRDTSGAIELEGIARARGLIAESELVVLVLDVNTDLSIQDRLMAELRTINEKFLVYFSKCGALGSSEPSRAQLRIDVKEPQFSSLSELEDGIVRYFDSSIMLENIPFMPNELQIQTLNGALDALNNAIACVKQLQLTAPELVASELHRTLGAISDIVGETTPDSVLNYIFSKFCIGK